MEIKILRNIFVAGFLSIFFIGCVASGKPKMHLIENKIKVDEAALVHPSTLPRGLMLIKSIGDQDTFSAAFGYLGSVYTPPGEYTILVDISFDFAIQDFGGPAWTVSKGQKCYPLEGINRKDFILVQNAVSKPTAMLEKGKSYQIRFGFERTLGNSPSPCTWIEELPSQSYSEIKTLN